MIPPKNDAKALMPGGAGDIPRVELQTSNSQAAVLTIKHSSRRGKLKNFYWNTEPTH